MADSMQCLNCKNYLGGFDDGAHCTAFPPDGKAIPVEIMSGHHDHREKFKGDNGIRYESLGIIDIVDED